MNAKNLHPRPPEGAFLIPGYKGYAATKSGLILSCRRTGRTSNKFTDDWKILKPVPCGKYGYLVVNLVNNSKQKNRYVHRLILETFVGPCPEGTECCHRNGDVTDNSLTNLKWGTHASNQRDMTLHGTSPKGEKNPFAKLKADQIVMIRDLVKNGAMPTRVAKLFNIRYATVWAIVTRHRWKHL